MFWVPGWPPRFFFPFPFRGLGFACGCWLLGGSEEFWGLSPNRPSRYAMRARRDSVNPCTAGVISAASSGGIVIGVRLTDDIVHVVPKILVRVQPSFSEKRAPELSRGVNGYLRQGQDDLHRPALQHGR